jgi:hypothetical protein
MYVHDSVSVDGGPGQLVNDIEHYSFSDLSDHLDRINLYSTLSARQMLERGRRRVPAHC